MEIERARVDQLLGMIGNAPTNNNENKPLPPVSSKWKLKKDKLERESLERVANRLANSHDFDETGQEVNVSN